MKSVKYVKLFSRRFSYSVQDNADYNGFLVQLKTHLCIEMRKIPPCTNSMCKLGELSKFLDYSSNVLEISSQLIWNIPVTYWKFPVGSKMILLFLDMFEAFKNSEKNRISLFHVSLPILTIKPSIYKGFSKLERIIIMVLCIFK